MNSQRTLTINPRNTLIVLAMAGTVIILLSTLGLHMRFFPHAYNVHNGTQANFLQDFGIEMDFNLKHNVASYFGLLFMALAAYLLFIVARFKKSTEKLPWVVTAWVVFFLSIDNLAAVLQKFNFYFGIENGPKAYFPISEIIVAVIFIMLLIALWRQLDNHTRWLFLAFALTYFSGIIAKELTLGANKNLSSALFILLEQALEYTGEILLVYALLHHLSKSIGEFSVSSEAG
ncbi:MAG: hypothetical protein H6635_04965 [Anaerolineales bacterium]|nr:hypothetical protein [Anaerolineales bacterium]MCB9144700.1 hypothetical protein [Anaerolineales bacterium]